jgi:ankyrin repeat protein
LNNINFVNLLLDFGANPNTRTEPNLGNESPLIMASANNYFQVANLLLDFGSDPTAKDGYGLTCLHYAAKNGHLEMCLLLIARGCDVNIRDDFGNNCSYWAKNNNHKELLKYLPPPQTVTPVENNNFKDMVEDFRNGDKNKKKRGGKK